MNEEKIKNGLVVNKVGNKQWYKNNLLHRKKGAAVQGINGDKRWYQHGELHREDGPAVEWGDGLDILSEEYWISGQQLTKEEFSNYVKIKELHNKLKNNLPINSGKLKSNKI